MLGCSPECMSGLGSCEAVLLPRWDLWCSLMVPSCDWSRFVGHRSGSLPEDLRLVLRSEVGLEVRRLSGQIVVKSRLEIFTSE